MVDYAGSINKVRNSVTNKGEDNYITNLHLFQYDPVREDPQKVANVVQDIVDIDIIIENTGNPKREGNMKYEVFSSMDRWRSDMGVLE